MSKRKNQPEQANIPTKITNSTTSNPPKSGLNMPIWWAIGAVLLIFIVSRIAYNGALDHSFVDWDDQLYVTENPMVLQHGKPGTPPVWSTPIALNYHPLTMESLIWNAKNAVVKNGLPEAGSFIATNINIHALNGMLVFLFVWLLTQGNLFVSLFTGLIFALHPMHVESVAWVSERKDVLYVFFFLIASCAYLRYLDTRKYIWFFAALAFFLLSCLSKAMAVSLVPVLLLLDWWRERPLRQAGVWIEKLPFVAIALFFGLMAIDIQGGGNFHGFLSGIEGVKTATGANDKFSLMDRFMLSSYGMVQYIIKFFVPLNLSPFYPYPEEFINKTALPTIYPVSFAAFTVLLGATIWSKAKTKVFLFGLGFYFFTVALVSQFFAVGLVVMADRYTYLPYIGLSLVVLLGIAHFIKGNKSMQMAAYGLLSVCSVWMLIQTQKQVEIWKNTESLWLSATEQFPREGQILANLGNHYGKTGQLEKAAVCFEKAIQQNIRNASVYEGLGNVYGSRGEHQKAADMFAAAIGIDPKKGNFYFNRGTAYLSIDPSKSIPDFTKAMELMPPATRAGTLSKRALAYIKTQNYQAALADYTSAIEAGSKSPNDYFDRGVAKLNLNDKAGAISDIEMSLKIDPKFEQAKNALIQLKQ